MKAIAMRPTCRSELARGALLARPSYCTFTGASPVSVYVGWKTAKHFPPILARAVVYDAAPSSTRSPGCALHGASLFLVWPRKSNQKEGHPYIRVLLCKTSLAPAVLQGIGLGVPSRWDVPVPWFLARRPCLARPCAMPALGLRKGMGTRGVWTLVGWKTAKHFPPQTTRPSNHARQDRWVSFALPTLRLIHTNALLHGPAGATKPPLSEGRTESVWRGASGMDAARGVKGHGWPLYAGPRNADGVREVERSETLMEGQAFLLTFFATEKSESPSRAKPMSKPTTIKGNVFQSLKQERSLSWTCKAQPVVRAEESAAVHMSGRASPASRASSLLRQQKLKHVASLSGEHALTCQVPQC